MVRARSLVPSACALSACAIAWLLSGLVAVAHAQAPGDADGDGLPDAWEIQFNLAPSSAEGDNGATGDPDGDGVTNAAEYAAGSHPRGTSVRLFAEGATGSLFDTRLALFNADLSQSSHTLLRFLREDGVTVPHFLTLLPGARATVDPEQLPGLETANFSTIIESDTAIVADRAMLWDDSHYGSHAETGLPRASTTWYLAEGATTGDFSLYYLLQNPQPTTAAVQITYLLPFGPPIVKQYELRPNSRTSLWVDGEDPALAAADVSGVIQSSIPIVVERAMYTNAGGLAFGNGSASAAVTEPAVEWFLAEGATGPFFDLFVLIANPNQEPAELTVTFLLSSGTPIEKTYTVGGRSRFTIPVDGIKGLQTANVSTIVRSTNGVPVLVERAMYWPGPTFNPNGWVEGHSSFGVTASATRWGLADGEEGGRDLTETYILIANTSTTNGSARVTLYFEDGGTAARDIPIQANSRWTVRIAEDFPEAANRRFAASVESLGVAPAALVVERAMYSSARGVHWAAGTASLGAVLPSGALVTNPAAVTVRATDSQIFEQGARGTTLTFTRGTADGPLTVAYSVGGTATPGSDYRALTGRVSFTAGELSVSVPVIVYDDGTAESRETMAITLVEDPDYRIGAPALATITVEDNDTVVLPAGDIDARRFLTQATFGPRPEDVAAVNAQGYEGWLQGQFAQPPSSFLAFLDATGKASPSETDLGEAWGQYAVAGADQLRQRVANALLEILVVSSANGLEGKAVAQAAYMDILQRNAFANFRTLLSEVTLSPAMGQYLSHLKNDKPGKNHDPDENYAREVLQLFTIGLSKLNLDGTVMRDGANNPIPTYDQSVVEGFAHVFTGWTYGHDDPARFYDAPVNWRSPMRGLQDRHATGAKLLLDGVTLPENQPMEEDLRQALDLIFNHPNVGPFVGRQLIQRLVMSNPSPAYVGRVAAAFANNGAGTRGDLQAVVRAILLDPEARDPELARGPYYGKLREPMIRFVTVLRAFHAHSESGRFRVSPLQNDFGQGPFKSPSVFNFFAPDFQPPGPIANLGLYAPEFQIAGERQAATSSNALRTLVRGGYGSEDRKIFLTLDTEIAMAGTPAVLADHLNTLLLNGQMTAELRNTIVESLDMMRADQPDRRAWVAISLVLTSPEFVVQK